MSISRRRLLQGAILSPLILGGLPLLTRSFAGTAAGIPVGLALYTIDPALQVDFEGTLRKVAQMGYRQVELSWFLNRSAKELRAALGNAGLQCESGIFHLKSLDAAVPNLPASEADLPKALESDLPKLIEFAHALGLKYIVYASFPHAPGTALVLDDFKRAAALYNKVGEQTKRAGIQVRVHNHIPEFTRFGSTLGYDEVLRSTDPELVSMEMDCGWVFATGQDPVRYLREYPKRITALHFRDRTKPSGNTGLESVQVGRGLINWKPIMAAAAAAGVRVGYVESDSSPALAKEGIKLDSNGGAADTAEGSLALAKGSFDYLTKLS